MTTFPTATAAHDYLISRGWTRTKCWTIDGEFYTKPGVRGDNPAIPMPMLVRIERSRVDQAFNQPDYFTIEFI